MRKYHFFCQHCHLNFDSKGKIIKWDSPIYGKCRKRIALCPECRQEVEEYRSARKSKNGSSKTEADSNYASGSCSTGTCPFIN